jgi:UDP-N-acetylglucosamine 2-epimerase
MSKLKVTTIVGTRPEIIRLSRVIAALDEHTDHQLIHTGQNYDYELNEIFFKDLELRTPDVFLEAAQESAAATIGQVIAKADAALAARRPDALLVLGDTNSCLSAIAAKRRHIPVFHMEAGNRCFDDRVPEEVNRRIIDHVADVNLPYSDIARSYLLREGLPPDRIIKTGSPMGEVLAFYRKRIEASRILADLGLERGKYFVVSAHREENVDAPDRFKRLLDVLETLARQHELPVIVSTHPRTRKRLDAEGGSRDTRIRFVKPLAFTDYVHLQMHARATLSDSGTISEESSLLNFPAVNIRDAHERPEAMEEGSVMMTGLSVERIAQALAILEGQPRGEHRLLSAVADYAAVNVSAKVVRLMLSYTDFVRRTVWQETV